MNKELENLTFEELLAKGISVTEANANATYGTSEPTPIPKLPPGKVLNLSQPTVSVPDIPEFTIPPFLSVAANNAAITHPADLSQGDWLIVARNSRILYGYTMDKKPPPQPKRDDEPPQAPDEPLQALKAALDWMVPDSIDFRVPMEDYATVKSEFTYSAETASYVQAGFDKQQASVGFPFAAASFEREHEERHAAASNKKQLQMIGRWYYPRVKLILKECATASERFKTAIRNALDTYDRDKDINPLLTVFQEYGTVVPNEVILGGYMLLVHTEDYQGSVNEHEVRNTISAAVSIKAKTGEGSAGMSFQNGLGTAVTADRMSKATQFTVRGGDTTLASNPQQWPNTVKPASEWAVIGRSNLTPIVDWLPQDLRSRVTALWPKVPIPPAVWELEDHDYSATGPSSQDHNGKAERAQFVLGARIVLDGGDGARGAVQLVCGTSMTPELGRGDAAGGAASFHRYRANDIWIDTSSVCLPVPAGHHYAATTPDTVGNAPVRFAIAETNLTFDQWHIVGDPAFQYSDRKFTALTDGFVFCTVQAWNDGDRGYITCEVDKILVAAASVHYYQYHDCWIRNACFCAPYTKGSVVEVKIFSTSGQLKPTVWQIPSTSQAWKFTKPEPFKVGASVKAVTDGFLNGVMVVAGDGPRGTLRLDCVKDQRAFQIFPIASASTHVYHQKDRWISHSSAMVPVRKGNQISANANITSGAPQVQVYWTGVVPA